MGFKSKIKEKMYMYYLKKGVGKAIKEIKAKDTANAVDIQKIIDDIDNSIKTIQEEVNTFSKAIDLVESKYGKNDGAAEISTIFPFLNLSMLDILILHKQYLRTDDRIEKNFICRTAALHMYEFLEDSSK